VGQRVPDKRAPLSDKQRAEIAEVRNFYDAKLERIRRA
jgi:hypothetical protein